MKIVILDGYSVIGNDLNFNDFKQFGELQIYERTTDNLVIERIGDAEIAFTNKVTIDKKIIDACKNLKYIGIFATGYNIVDIEYARKKGIDVCNVPSYSTNSVAQMVFSMILDVTTHVALHNKSVHDGDWENCKDFCYWKTPLTELSGKTIGIIGYGSIGQQVANIARAFKMNVLYKSRRKIDGDVSLEYLLKNSDFVTLHCPLNSQNNKIINHESLSLMKPSAFLINTARGGLVDEHDLAEALNNNKISGACVDVVSKEPIEKGNPLLQAKNCLITPHIAWAPKETRIRLLDIAKNNLQSWFDGKPQNVVN